MSECGRLELRFLDASALEFRVLKRVRSSRSRRVSSAVLRRRTAARNYFGRPPFLVGRDPDGRQPAKVPGNNFWSTRVAYRLSPPLAGT
jgi:hypothetical protein